MYEIMLRTLASFARPRKMDWLMQNYGDQLTHMINPSTAVFLITIWLILVLMVIALTRPCKVTPKILALIAAYDSVTRIWDHELFTAAQRIPTLLQGNAETHEPRPIDPQPFNIDHTLAAENSGLTFFPPSTLENWM